jgi:hypothetical protein
MEAVTSRGRAHTQAELERIQMADPARYARIIARRMNEDEPVAFMMWEIQEAVKDLEVVESRDLPGPVCDWIGRTFRLTRNGIGRRRCKEPPLVTVEGFMRPRRREGPGSFPPAGGIWEKCI